ncbi:polysaccharide deacetylase family protein [Dongia sedimenti]|uniref:Chitooligosaccharide deacetylase n=1 Tax=Dongia sedimenti TaxID=3064282 RepID=A0ABU0YPV2_9PROT|nr:polysaccharide deacetylase family protein [Rhodospirillaceae bacterium R-7]
MVVPHGIMLHHFWDDRHPKGQGAISGDAFARMIEWLDPARILPAREWLERAQAGALQDDQLCLTFDDALRCQYDVAVPVLRKYGLTAFWFVYSSVFEGGVEPLEVFRYFRTAAFPDIESFYAAFDRAARNSPYAGIITDSDRKTDYARHLEDFAFYSMTDRRFRYLRDHVLGNAAYEAIMWQMVRETGWEERISPELLWMDNGLLSTLAGEGHVIGLHSYSHPTVLANLSEANQRSEYARNARHLTECLGAPPVAMSHPCNSYNATTLDILSGMGIRLGFRSNMAKLDGGALEAPRRDHASVMAEMDAQ